MPELQRCNVDGPAGDTARINPAGLAALRAGLLTFALAFLGHLLVDPCAEFHSGLCGALDRAVQPGRRIIGAIPREHAKTTLGTVALVTREICRGAKKNIMLIGANREEAAAKLRLVLEELETNEALTGAFGDAVSPARDIKGQLVAYGDTEVILTGGARLTALGFGGKVRGQLAGGRRLDLVILDDPEDDRLVASSLRRRQMRDWVDRALINALDANHGSLIWLGTLLHHDSVLAQLIRDNGKLAGWDSFIRPAILDNGQPLWPGRWSLEKLALRRAEIGERAFAQEYLNRPASRDEQLFPAGCFRQYSAAALKTNSSGTFLGGDELRVVIGVDPAIGLRDSNDYFAAAVVGTDERGRIHILDLAHARLRFSAQLDLIKSLEQRWQPRLIGVEATAYQAALSHTLIDRGMPVLPIQPDRSKLVRIEALAACADRGLLYLPDRSNWVSGFREEAGEFPHGRHDDQLDAVACALQAGGRPGDTPQIQQSRRLRNIGTEIEQALGAQQCLNRF